MTPRLDHRVPLGDVHLGDPRHLLQRQHDAAGCCVGAAREAGAGAAGDDGYVEGACCTDGRDNVVQAGREDHRGRLSVRRPLGVIVRVLL